MAAPLLMRNLGMPWRSLLLLCLAVAPLLTGATDKYVNDDTASSDQVMQAILNSPNASADIKAIAGSVGSLAMFESAGSMNVYNGSCCYGILQMSSTNIRNTTGLGAEEFRRLPLQDQVNAWATIMSQSMLSSPVKQLREMGTFDGRPVDGSMELACIQLGTGNCLTMIRSGKCSGFADTNGTTICAMADKIAAGMVVTPKGPTIESRSHDSWFRRPDGVYEGPRFISDCITDGYGRCLPMDQAVADGFRTGSGGVSMGELRQTIQMICIATTMLVLGAGLLGMWRMYTVGRLGKPELINGSRKAMLAALFVFVVLSVV